MTEGTVLIYKLVEIFKSKVGEKRSNLISKFICNFIKNELLCGLI